MRSGWAFLAFLAFLILAPLGLAADQVTQAAGRGPLELSLKRAVELATSAEETPEFSFRPRR